MSVIALNPQEKKDYQFERIDIGLTVGREPTTLDDKTKRLDIVLMASFEPTITQLKAGRFPERLKQQFNTGLITSVPPTNLNRILAQVKIQELSRTG